MSRPDPPFPRVETKLLRPTDAAARALIEALDAYQTALYPAESNHFDSIEELSRPHVVFLGAYTEGRLVGCGAVKLMGARYGEIKRMYVTPQARGRGVGRTILLALEAHAAGAGVDVLRLETGVKQLAAIGLYRRNGFRERGPFGTYREDPLSLFMEKRLT